VIPEELCVGEARAQHSLVGGDDRRASVFGEVVGDEQEMESG
jgi:hypothetical protein